MEERLSIALEQVTTPYVMLHADDDIVSASALELSANYLDINPDYEAIHGYYLSFFVDSCGSNWAAMLPESLEYNNKLDDVNERIIYGFQNYSPLFYSVVRTNTLRTIISCVLRNHLVNMPFQLEFLINFGLIIAGKERYLPIVYMAREHSLVGHQYQPLTFWYCDPCRRNEKDRFHMAMYDICNELGKGEASPSSLIEHSVRNFFDSFKLMYQRNTVQDKKDFFEKWGWNYFYIHNLGKGKHGTESLIDVISNLDKRFNGFGHMELIRDWQTIISFVSEKTAY
jgi:hypothetical protein